MITQNIKALVEYRLEQADESLEAARILLEKTMLRRETLSAHTVRPGG